MKAFDYIGFTPQLYIDSLKRFKTSLGGSLTILLVILSLLAICAFGKDLLFKENPSLYQYDKFSLTNTIDFKEIPFVIGLMKPGGFSIENLNRKVEITIDYSMTNSSNLEVPTKDLIYDLIPCVSSNLFKNDVMNITKNTIGDPKNFYCLPDNLNLTWYGKF